ncbi:MAG: class I SAM-dependent methyltransferase [Ignavibacteriales bacterium]
MNHHRHLQDTLENPERLAELSPKETLIRMSLGKDDVVCDIGAGTGVFTIPAAQITKNAVFALDTKDELLEIIRDKAQSHQLTNIKTVKVMDNSYDIQEGSVDFIILVTVLHEIANKDAFLTEIKRIMKNTARLSIIELHKHTSVGPPNAPRLSMDEVTTICKEVGFYSINEFNLGKNYYCVVLTPLV